QGWLTVIRNDGSTLGLMTLTRRDSSDASPSGVGSAPEALADSQPGRGQEPPTPPRARPSPRATRPANPNILHLRILMAVPRYWDSACRSLCACEAPAAACSGAGSLTARTGQGAVRTSFSAVLPIKSRRRTL